MYEQPCFKYFFLQQKMYKDVTKWNENCVGALSDVPTSP